MKSSWNKEDSLTAYGVTLIGQLSENSIALLLPPCHLKGSYSARQHMTLLLLLQLKIQNNRYNIHTKSFSANFLKFIYCEYLYSIVNIIQCNKSKSTVYISQRMYNEFKLKPISTIFA